MRVKILRQKFPDSKPYWECFIYKGNINNSVAEMLDELNYDDDIVDENGSPSTRIAWECSCLQGKCGGCAMVINGKPSLACETFIKDLKGKTITIKPLSKFPVIRDLLVDRSVIHDNLKKAGTHIQKINKQATDDDHTYTLSKCLKCGLCLEVCPNYKKGTDFFGALFANDCYFIDSKSLDSDIRQKYKKYFAKGCSKSLSCMDVCPMKIQTITSISKLNRKK